MKLNKILETIASNSRFNISIEEILTLQSNDIKEIFSIGDSALLKYRLENSSISADRTTIFQI